VNIRQALEIVVARTGHVRYGELCEPSWPDFEAYRQLVMRLAEGDLPGIAVQTPLSTGAALKRRLAILACPYRGQRVDCGCGDLRHCSADRGAGPWRATYNECWQCAGRQLGDGQAAAELAAIAAV
jgi:hypothetical protein